VEKKKGDESRKRKRKQQREEKPAGLENIKTYKRPVPKVDVKKIKDKKLKSDLKQKVNSPIPCTDAGTGALCAPRARASQPVSMWGCRLSGCTTPPLTYWLHCRCGGLDPRACPPPSRLTWFDTWFVPSRVDGRDARCGVAP